jgi:cobalt/nickel transport system ATP-binding protein
MDPETVFDVSEVSFAYDGRQPALDGVSLQVEAGECLAVLGSNGSGKSTLLKLLDGLYFPDEGTITCFGEPLAEAALREEAFNFRFRRRVGLVFQDPDVQLFSASVLEEVAFAPLQLGLPRDEVSRRVDSALAALRIEKLRDRPPHRLSGGEKRRVALASLLSLEPEVWLMDEPNADLDPRSQSWLAEFIHGLRAGGRTVVIASHDLDAVAEVATRVVVLDEDHRVAASGPPGQILRDHDLLHRCNLVHFHATGDMSHESP